MEIDHHIKVCPRGDCEGASGNSLYQGQPAIVFARGLDIDRIIGICAEVLPGEVPKGKVSGHECDQVVHDPVLVTWTGAREFPCSHVAEQAIWVPPVEYGVHKLAAHFNDAPIYDDKPQQEEMAIAVRACRLIIYGHTRGVGHLACWHQSLGPGDSVWLLRQGTNRGCGSWAK